MAAAADMTMAELRQALVPPIVEAAAFDGWSMATARQAAQGLGLSPDAAHAVFPGGAMDMIAAWIASVDAAMTEALPANLLGVMPIRERIGRLVRSRLDAIAGHEEALRRAMTVMTMPQNALRTMRLGWRSADLMWRLAGDRATDFNHYTKRAILAGIYAATLAVFAEDRSEAKAETHAFLDRRIDGVMRFEKAKAQMLRPRGEHFSAARFLGRLRYPAR